MEMSHLVPPSPGTTGSDAAGAPTGTRRVAADDDVSDQRLELGAGPRGEGLGQPLIELVDRQAPFAGGPAQQLGGLLAIGV